MAISEDLQRRIQNLTGDTQMGALGPYIDTSADVQAMRDLVGPTKGAISNREMELFQQASPSMGGEGQEIINQIEAEEGPLTDEEKQEVLQQIEGMSQKAQAPLAAEAQELAQTGEGPDTILAHLEQGDVVIPPDLIEDDPEFESYIEQKFNDYNINPEERVAQVGVASLFNPQTGLQQFGFLKKIGKKLKKVIRPIAKIAQYIPGPWQPIAALANKALTVYDVAKGKISPLALLSVAGPLRTGPSIRESIGAIKGATAGGGFFKGLGSLARETGTVGSGGIADLFRGGGRGAFGGENIFQNVKGLMRSANPDDYIQAQDAQGKLQWVNKITGEGLPFGAADPSDLLTRSGSGIRRFTKGLQGNIFGTEGMMGGITEGTGAAAGTYTDAANNVYTQQQMIDAGLVNPSTGQLIQQVAPAADPLAPVADPLAPVAAQRGPFGGTILPKIAGALGLSGSGTGGGGGIGSLLGLAGAAGLAGALGKLAYEETKGMRGVPITPMTALGPTGRFNIEAEVNRRMGLPPPDPIEFGLLPEGTLPELSGGRPLEEPIPVPARYGGPVMAYAQGGNVALTDFERMNGNINGMGTETSDEIPAMLSDGEFVMTGQAVRGAGSYELAKEDGGILTLIPSLDEDRERGTELMYTMMEEFGSHANA
jgi:hypothetical protein